MQTNTVLATNDLSLTTFTSVLDQPVPVLEHSKASSGLSGILRNLGASNHTPEERQPDDFYATDPRAASLLLDVEEFSGKIEVHHRKPLYEIKEDYVVDPVKDLVPVCPNCHMVIHSKKDGVYTVEEVKSMLHRNDY